MRHKAQPRPWFDVGHSWLAFNGPKLVKRAPFGLVLGPFHQFINNQPTKHNSNHKITKTYDKRAIYT